MKNHKPQTDHMKKGFSFFIITLFSLSLKAQSNDLPVEYTKDSLPSLIQKSKEVLSHAYMVQKLLTVTDTLTGWEGFPVKLYEYQTGVTNQRRERFIS